MIATQHFAKMNNKLITKLFDIRPINALLKKCLSQNDQNDLFKFYSDEVNDLGEKYRPLTENDYNRFISRRSAKREPALTRQITSLAYKVGKQMLSLAEGMPTEDVFPYSKMTLETRTGERVVMEGKEMATALQYVPSQGLPPLITSLQQFQQDLHRPPALPREILVTNGSQHGIYQCFDLLLEPGDPLLMSEFSYPGAHIALKPYDPEILGIPEDTDGMDPSIMESVLEERLAQGLKMPKLLYVIPTGNNPTGSLLSEERRRHIYELACRYDFLILEDDPYMFLNYTGKIVPSFLSLDVCGRVVRLDSLSKVVSAGLRAAWCSAPRALARRLELHMQAELLHSCSLAQAILYRFLSSRSSLATHLHAARALYGGRRDALHAALCGAGVEEVAQWSLPDAGLFLWLSVRNVDDIYNMVFKTAFERGLMLIPGQAFFHHTGSPCRHVRLTYSKIPVEQMPTAARHLADIIRSEQRLVSGEQPQRIATER